MAHLVTKEGRAHPNFIGSAIGLTPKTRQLTQEMAATVNGAKVVLAGTVFPSNDANAEGIVFQDVDVTDGPCEGSVIVAGRIYKNRLPVAPAAVAITAMEARGLYFEDASGMTR